MFGRKPCEKCEKIVKCAKCKRLIFIEDAQLVQIFQRDCIYFCPSHRNPWEKCEQPPYYISRVPRYYKERYIRKMVEVDENGKEINAKSLVEKKKAKKAR